MTSSGGIFAVANVGETKGYVTYLQVKCNVEKSETSCKGLFLYVDSLQIVKNIRSFSCSASDTDRETLLSPETVCNKCLTVK